MGEAWKEGSVRVGVTTVGHWRPSLFQDGGFHLWSYLCLLCSFLFLHKYCLPAGRSTKTALSNSKNPKQRRFDATKNKKTKRRCFGFFKFIFVVTKTASSNSKNPKQRRFDATKTKKTERRRFGFFKLIFVV